MSTKADKQLAMVNVVEILADLIRSLYITHRRRVEEQLSGRPSAYEPGAYWDGGRSKGVQRESVWPGVAKHFILNGIAPEPFMMATFTNITRKEQIPMPGHLTGPVLYNYYRDNFCEPQPLAAIELAYELQRKHVLGLELEYDLTTKWTTEEKKLKIILSNESRLSPLFRHCLAASEGFEAIAAKYLVPATMQFLRYPEEYQKVWGDFIPKETSEHALGLQLLYTGQGGKSGKKA